MGEAEKVALLAAQGPQLGHFEEPERLKVLSAEYHDKFGWPFLLAPGATSRAALLSLERRLTHGSCEERVEVLGELHKAAYVRLLASVEPAPTGSLTCHVLDTARGCPASGMRIALRRRTGDGPDAAWAEVGSWITNSDGRLPDGPAISGAEVRVGVYEWVFAAGEYFAGCGADLAAAAPFLDEVPLRFGISDPEAHYHVPLLVSPWSFSTYRGS